MNLIINLPTEPHFWDALTAIGTIALAVVTCITLGFTIYYSNQQIKTLDEQAKNLEKQSLEEKHQRARNCAVDFYDSLTQKNLSTSSTAEINKVIKDFISDFQRVGSSIAADDYSSLKNIRAEALELQKAIYGRYNARENAPSANHFNPENQAHHKQLDDAVNTVYFRLLESISNYLKIE